MTPQDDDTEKSHEPTAHKLEEARKKGELVRSADLATAAGYGGVLLAALTAGESSIVNFSTAMMVLLDQPDRLIVEFFRDQSSAPVGGLLSAIGHGVLAWFLIPAVGVVAVVIAQRAFVFAPSKLAPRLSRIDPIQNAKNKYGPSGLFEFAKSFAKLVLYSLVLGVYLSARLSDMAGAVHGEPRIVGLLMGQMMIEFMAVVLCVALVIGVIDYLWQRFDHLRRHRMSHRDLQDEHKQHEGDPHMKQERRQRASRLASEQMMANVPNADVVIVNPTHYAVALTWSRAPNSAPVCVAKGVDHMALAIREMAEDHGVPVRSDPPTARAIHAMTEIGMEIDPEQYQAVAAAIRFSEAMRHKARARG
ncbi:EscU/YscU/HrcU family type III secretion system export apparatus switch protein [Roseovarius sp.]|jgi:flagellar biosynthetic protein FlhB